MLAQPVKVIRRASLEDARMPAGTRVWQRVVLVLCLVGLLAVVESAWATYYLEGDAFGGEPFGPVTTSQFVDTFQALVPGSVAERAGIRIGDAIDLRRMIPGARYHLRNELLAGEPLRLPIVRNGTIRTLTVTPATYTTIPFWAASQLLFDWAFWLGSAIGLFVAALLIWRRPDNIEVRLLSLTLALIMLGENLFPINGWLTPWAAFDAVLNVFAQIIFSAGVALFAIYALLFGLPVSAFRRTLTALTVAIATLSALIWNGAGQGGPGPGGVLGIAGLWFGVLDLHAWFGARPLLLFAAVVGPAMMALLCAILAVRASSGAERPRVAWATGSLAILYLFGIATVQSYFVGNPVIYYWILNVSWIVAPLGLTYALLRRRLLDVGFVLNRAAVFTAVSLVVVGLFTLVEWALGGWLHTAGRIANVSVSAAIALALGLSLHQIHARVDRFVDNVFFRQRHEDELALKRFAREVAFITNRDVVLLRAKETIEKHADASAVEFALDDGRGHYGTVGENDAALVALRASHEAVDLHLLETGFAGEFAYPMLARGRLIGALVLGSKRSGEPYAPDESLAIAQLAHAVGITLDLLAVRTPVANEEIIGAIRSLETSTRAMTDALRDLPDSIARRMRELRL
ncbi:MAG TPA: hypothetical protein VGZ02_05025 [Candidatus Baltobacteraceae bacterium]|jgi:hypothetical protein|nr:hypothetical protein [Candidatus Baltobacteraceae bacterium]